jgi:hypothetical protein
MFAPENTLVAPQHCPAGQLRNSAAAMALSLGSARRQATQRLAPIQSTRQRPFPLVATAGHL